MQRFGLPLFAVVLTQGVWFAPPVGVAASDDSLVNFDRDIRPILSNNCYKCHGPDEAKRQAGLRLDTIEGERAELKSGHRAVVPGRTSDSALFARITAADPTERMPPPSTGKVLTSDQIALFKRWVEQGAEWLPHWSFVPVNRPRPPAVKDEAWIQNVIDRFVLARLERENLQPSGPADKTTM